jgi:hypothetical protein
VQCRTIIHVVAEWASCMFMPGKENLAVEKNFTNRREIRGCMHMLYNMCVYAFVLMHTWCMCVHWCTQGGE